MAPFFNDDTVLKHHDPVRVSDGRQTVRDCDHGAPFPHCLELCLNPPLGFRVQRAGRLVQQQDWRILEKGPRDPHALLFTTRKLQPAFPDRRLVPVGQAGDEIVDFRSLAAAMISSSDAVGRP